MHDMRSHGQPGISLSRSCRIQGSAVLLAFIMAAPAAAQDSTDVDQDDWLVGGSIGVPGFQSDAVPELFTLGVQATSTQPGRPGVDFSIGTMPYALVMGVLALGMRAGVALPVELSPGMLLVPSAGASLIAGFAGEGGAGALPGLNAGLTAVVFGDGPTGFRAGATWHLFRDFEPAVWLLEIGFVRRR